MFDRNDYSLFGNSTTLVRTAQLAANELTDNALDTETGCRAGLLDGNGFWVENGIAGSDDEIAAQVSIDGPSRSVRVLRQPTRGALGGGLRYRIVAVLVSVGLLIVATVDDRVLRLHRRDDGQASVERVGEPQGPRTRVEVQLGQTLPVDETALPWARESITLAESGARDPGKTSPFRFDPSGFFGLLPGSVERAVGALMAGFDGFTGPRAGGIAASFKDRLARDSHRDEAERLLSSSKRLTWVDNPEYRGGMGPAILGLPSRLRQGPWDLRAEDDVEPDAGQGMPGRDSPRSIPQDRCQWS